MTPAIVVPWMTAAVLSLSMALPDKISPTTTISSTTVISSPSPFQQEVVRNRQLKQVGVTAGGGLMVAALGAGVAGGILDPVAVLVPTTVTAGLAAVTLYRQSFINGETTATPLSDDYFVVKPSSIPNAGQGLYAAQSISANTFLFCYGGESLSEDEYFRRYPTQADQGRYVAFVDGPPWFWGSAGPTYIDGIDPDISGWARWANSMPNSSSSGGGGGGDSNDHGLSIAGAATANMYKKPQRFGPNAGTMYMYATRDIIAGEELFHDYGQQYWTAVGRQEEEDVGVDD